MEKYSLKFNKRITISILIFVLFCIFLYTTNVSAKTCNNGAWRSNTYYYSTSTNDITWSWFNNYTTYNTRIDGKMTSFVFVGTDNLTANHSYNLSFEMATNDWAPNVKNADASLIFYGSGSTPSNTCSGSQVYLEGIAEVLPVLTTSIGSSNVKKITYTFVAPSNVSGSTNWAFFLSAFGVSNHYITGVNNWSLASVSLQDLGTATDTSQIINNDNKNTQSIINSQNNIKDSIESTKDTLTDDNIDNDLGNDFFNDFNDEDFGLSDIITLPLTTIQSLTSKSCLPLQVPIPFTDDDIELPCMSEIYEDNFGSIYNLWKIVSFGIIAYSICIDIFKLVKGFKDPDNDKIEVLDL